MLTKYKCALRRDTIIIMAEPKGDPSLDNEGGLSPGEKSILDMNFAKCMLNVDAGSSLFSISMRAHLGGLEKIASIQTYEEYFREKASDYQNPEAYYNYVMSKSDPALVQEWNSKIRAFNDDLERIKQEKDEQKAQSFYDEMMALLRTKRV